ncbi:MAG TPA: ABC transporter ATP-binding protein [Candidatus Saccharimonadia bacterium]|nr:ABC transporter ATP-binding protein [Candidatus Saccharimonadia bacterium]
MSEIAIDCQKLSKRYPHISHFALKDLSLSVKAGEVYGFLGPNGAGKSTTIRTLLNLLQPTSGHASILGLDIVKDSVAVKSKVGYLSGEFSPYRKLTGRQFLEYMAELQPLKNKACQKQLVDTFAANLNQPLETLSKGNKQKLGLIQAFMHEPEVLILDEPTSGLDPLMQEEFFKLVRAVQANGSAVFVSSHNFAEVLRMCDHVGFIREGELVAEESIALLQAKAAHSFIITFADKAPLAALKKVPKAAVTAHDDTHVRVQMRGELTPLFAVLAKHRVLKLDQEEANLEQEFLRYYTKGTAK